MPAPSVSMQCSGGGAGEGLGGSKPHSTPRARGEANTPHVTRPHAQRRLHHFTSLSGGTEDCLDADAHHYTRLPPQTRQPARAGDPTSRAAALRSPSSRRRRDVAPRRVRHSASARPYCYVRASRPPCRPVRSLKRPAASRYRAYCYREGCSRGPLDGAKGGTKATPPLCAPLRASPPPRAAEAPAMTRTRAHAERGAAIRRPAPPAARRGERGWARGVSCGKEWRSANCAGDSGAPCAPFSTRHAAARHQAAAWGGEAAAGRRAARWAGAAAEPLRRTHAQIRPATSPRRRGTLRAPRATWRRARRAYASLGAVGAQQCGREGLGGGVGGAGRTLKVTPRGRRTNSASAPHSAPPISKAAKDHPRGTPAARRRATRCPRARTQARGSHPQADAPFGRAQPCLCARWRASPRHLACAAPNNRQRCYTTQARRTHGARAQGREVQGAAVDACRRRRPGASAPRLPHLRRRPTPARRCPPPHPLLRPPRDTAARRAWRPRTRRAL